jgi:hypothetical protein
MDVLLSKSNPGQRKNPGTDPTVDPGTMGFGPSPSGPEDMNPNFDNKPQWMKIVTASGLGIIAGAELGGPLYDLYTSLTNRGTQAQQLLNTQLSSPSVQTRYQATQSYNAASGATSNGSKLWVTPNGAVVNWNGGVVAPAPSSKAQK